MSLIDDYKLAGALFGGKTIQPTGTGYTSADTYTLTGIAQADSSGGTVSILLDNYDPDDPENTTCSTAVSVKSGDRVLVSVTGFSFSVTSVIGGGDRTQGEINAVTATADGKNRVLYFETDPDEEGETDGDICFVVMPSTGTIVRQWRWSATTNSWEDYRIDSQFISSITAGKITAGTIEAAVEMTSATVTGGLVRTSATGNRIEIYDDDDAGYIRFHDANGAPRATLGTRVADNVFNIGAGSNDSYAANIDVASTYNASTELLEGTITLDAGENTSDPGRDSGLISIDKTAVEIVSSVDGTNSAAAVIRLTHAGGVGKVGITGQLIDNGKVTLTGTAVSTGGMPNTAGSAWRWTNAQTVTFAEAFSSTPVVIANITSTTGVSACHVKSKSASGFTWGAFEYGAADTGRNVSIDWIAIGDA